MVGQTATSAPDRQVRLFNATFNGAVVTQLSKPPLRPAWHHDKDRRLFVTHTAAYQEKNKAAASSVLAAIGLTSLKIVVGVLTGSLGILAEAAHSALDLVAALMTWFAVRVSGKPPDRTHLYGHGKVENLSALLETLLLLATCVWVV
ncbi:MAG: cation diffusion facilitator family transporter, partial [Bryobacteraceae bacterium]